MKNGDNVFLKNRTKTSTKSEPSSKCIPKPCEKYFGSDSCRSSDKCIWSMNKCIPKDCGDTKDETQCGLNPKCEWDERCNSPEDTPLSRLRGSTVYYGCKRVYESLEDRIELCGAIADAVADDAMTFIDDNYKGGCIELNQEVYACAWTKGGTNDNVYASKFIRDAVVPCEHVSYKWVGADCNDPGDTPRSRLVDRETKVYYGCDSIYETAEDRDTMCAQLCTDCKHGTVDKGVVFDGYKGACIKHNQPLYVCVDPVTGHLGREYAYLSEAQRDDQQNNCGSLDRVTYKWIGNMESVLSSCIDATPCNDIEDKELCNERAWCEYKNKGCSTRKNLPTSEPTSTPTPTPTPDPTADPTVEPTASWERSVLDKPLWPFLALGDCPEAVYLIYLILLGQKLPFEFLNSVKLNTKGFCIEQEDYEKLFYPYPLNGKKRVVPSTEIAGRQNYVNLMFKANCFCRSGHTAVCKKKTDNMYENPYRDHERHLYYDQINKLDQLDTKPILDPTYDERENDLEDIKALFNSSMHEKGYCVCNDKQTYLGGCAVGLSSLKDIEEDECTYITNSKILSSVDLKNVCESDTFPFCEWNGASGNCVRNKCAKKTEGECQKVDDGYCYWNAGAAACFEKDEHASNKHASDESESGAAHTTRNATSADINATTNTNAGDAGKTSPNAEGASANPEKERGKILSPDLITIMQNEVRRIQASSSDGIYYSDREFIRSLQSLLPPPDEDFEAFREIARMLSNQRKTSVQGGDEARAHVKLSYT